MLTGMALNANRWKRQWYMKASAHNGNTFKANNQMKSPLLKTDMEPVFGKEGFLFQFFTYYELTINSYSIMIISGK